MPSRHAAIAPADALYAGSLSTQSANDIIDGLRWASDRLADCTAVIEAVDGLWTISSPDVPGLHGTQVRSDVPQGPRTIAWTPTGRLDDSILRISPSDGQTTIRVGVRGEKAKAMVDLAYHAHPFPRGPEGVDRETLRGWTLSTLAAARGMVHASSLRADRQDDGTRQAEIRQRLTAILAASGHLSDAPSRLVAVGATIGCTETVRDSSQDAPDLLPPSRSAAWALPGQPLVVVIDRMMTTDGAPHALFSPILVRAKALQGLNAVERLRLVGTLPQVPEDAR